MKDGLYRIVSKEGTRYGIVEVDNDSVCDSNSVMTDSPVEDYLKKGYTFTRVYPIHLPDEMWEEIHNEALRANLSDDDVVETAIRNFFIYFRPAPEYRKVVRNED